VDREGTAQEKGKDKVSGVRCLFGDGAGRATGWAQTQRRGAGGQGGTTRVNKKIRCSGAQRYGTDTLFTRRNRGNDGPDVKQNFKSTVRIKRLRGLPVVPENSI
jgi:hypothetical protein